MILNREVTGCNTIDSSKQQWWKTPPLHNHYHKRFVTPYDHRTTGFKLAVKAIITTGSDHEPAVIMICEIKKKESGEPQRRPSETVEETH